MASPLPIIDFAAFVSPSSSLEEKNQAARALDKACREVGFFYLKNHGVPQDLIADLLAQTREFFETATPTEKACLALRGPVQGGDNARGWLRVVNEKSGTHEALDIFRPVATREPPYETGRGPNHWPMTPPQFRPIAESYIEYLEALGKQVMKAIAMGLAVDEQIFLERVDKSFWNLRILGYEGRTGKKQASAGIGEHTDFGILTFLLTDSCKQSLQVLSKTGEWIWADPIEGCYIVNIGDMLSAWTRGAYKSTLHRVRHSSDTLRISIPFFFDPNLDAIISPVLPAPEDGAVHENEDVRYIDKFVRSLDYSLFKDSMTGPPLVTAGAPVAAPVAGPVTAPAVVV